MRLPVSPPVAPMLAKPVKKIPEGPYSYEPKWDGFRSIIFRDGGEVEIGSRNERPMTRYFPELVSQVIEQFPERCVIDGEIVVPDSGGVKLDFEALLQRIHPAASRVNLLAEQTPARFVAFDLLALGDDDYTDRPFAERRAALESALASVRAPLHVTPATTDRELAAQWFSQFEGAGLAQFQGCPSNVVTRGCMSVKSCRRCSMGNAPTTPTLASRSLSRYRPSRSEPMASSLDLCVR